MLVIPVTAVIELNAVLSTTKTVAKKLIRLARGPFPAKAQDGDIQDDCNIGLSQISGTSNGNMDGPLLEEASLDTAGYMEHIRTNLQTTLPVIHSEEVCGLSV